MTARTREALQDSNGAKKGIPIRKKGTGGSWARKDVGKVAPNLNVYGTREILWARPIAKKTFLT